MGNQIVDGPHLMDWLKNTMEVNGVHQLFGYPYSSKYHLLCSAEERNSYRVVETTWGWVNYDTFSELWL